MITAAFYKTALVSLLIITGATSGGVTYYYQLRTNDMSSQITNLTGQVSKANSQVKNLTDQISGLSNQVGQLQATNSQLNRQVQELQTEIVRLNSLSQKQVTLLRYCNRNPQRVIRRGRVRSDNQALSSQHESVLSSPHLQLCLLWKLF